MRKRILAKKGIAVLLAFTMMLTFAVLPTSNSSANEVIALYPTVVDGRTLSASMAGDSSDWIELARNARYSLMIRKDPIPNSRMAYDSKNTDVYILSGVRTAVNNWFNRTLSQDARLRDYTIRANPLQEIGQLGQRNTGLSRPSGNLVRFGDDVAFLLSFSEAAQFCSELYAGDVRHVMMYPSHSFAISNYNKLSFNPTPPGGAHREFFWLRSGGTTLANYDRSASVVGTIGPTCRNAVVSTTVKNTNPVLRPAVWVSQDIFEAAPTRVIYHPNGGWGDVSFVNVPNNSNYVIVDQGYTRANFRQAGWNTRADGTGTSYTTGQMIFVSGEVNLYAQWTGLQATIAYYPNGASGSSSASQAPVNSFVTIWGPDYLLSGYNFTGWNTRSDGTGTQYFNGQTIFLTADLHLYAQWVQQQGGVTYYPNGGTGLMNFVSLPANSTYTVVDQGYTRAGFRFTGWNTRSDGTGIKVNNGQLIFVSDKMDLYAQWSAGTASVAYYPNGGLGGRIDSNIGVGTNYTIRTGDQAGVSRFGWIFQDWNTRADGTGVTYAPGQSILVENDLILFARWRQ